MKACEPLHPRGDDRHILVGDLNVAPHENDVWSHKQLLKVVSHTPIECEKLLAAQAHGEWIDVARERIQCRKKCTLGGVTAPPTGRLPIVAEGSITSGYRAPSRRVSAISGLHGTRAAGSARLIMCR